MRYLIILFVVVTQLAATQKTVLQYWTPFSGGDARPMQFIVEKFNHSQDKYTVVMRVIKWADYYTLLTKSIQEKKAPDIAIAHASKLAELIAKKQLEPLDSMHSAKAFDWKGLTASSRKSVVFDTLYYAVPIDTHLLLLYYNKKYLKKVEQLNVKGELLLQQGEKAFIDLFQTLQQKLPHTIEPLGQAINNVWPYWWWYSFYMQQNENKGFIQGKKALFNNKAGLKALEFLTTLRDTGIYSKFITDTQAYNMFKYEKSAIMLSGVWSRWNFKQNKNLDFGVSAFPQIFENKAVIKDSHTLVIPVGKHVHKQGILTFAEFVTNNGVIWSNAGHIPTKIKVLKSTEYLTNPLNKAFASYLPFTTTISKHPKQWECNTKMIEIVASMMQSNKTAKETLAQAHKEITLILNRD